MCWIVNDSAAGWSILSNLVHIWYYATAEVRQKFKVKGLSADIEIPRTDAINS